MSIKLKRSISPDGFINSLTVEYEIPDELLDGDSEDAALARVESIARKFQAEHPTAQRGRNAPSYAPQAAAPQATSAPDVAVPRGTHVATVFSVEAAVGRGPVKVIMSDGRKLQTFDHKIAALEGKAIEYAYVEKTLSRGAKVNELVVFKEVKANVAPNVAPIESEGHANF